MTVTEEDRGEVGRTRTESPSAVVKIGIPDEKQCRKGTFDGNDRLFVNCRGFKLPGWLRVQKAAIS
jgi:hypothetical protein